MFRFRGLGSGLGPSMTALKRKTAAGLTCERECRRERRGFQSKRPSIRGAPPFCEGVEEI